MKGLLHMLNQGDASCAGPAAPSSSKPHLEFGPGGYPKVPLSTKVDSLSKDDLEKLFRDYMSQHYCMFILDMIIVTKLSTGGKYTGCWQKQTLALLTDRYKHYTIYLSSIYSL